MIGDSTFSGRFRYILSNFTKLSIFIRKSLGNPLNLGVIFPTSLTSIGSSSFSLCLQLKSVIIPTSLTLLGTVRSFFDIHLYFIQSHFDAQFAFHDDFQLISVHFPTSISEISTGCFLNCGLPNITIPTLVIN